MGVEMAEATLRRGLETTLITRSDVMSSLDPDMSMRISTALKEAGVEVVTGTELGSLTRGPRGAVNGVVTADGRICRADVVVLGIGVRPASELGAQAGLALGRSGGYLPIRADASATASGPPATVAKPSAGSLVSTFLSRSARMPTSRAGSSVTILPAAARASVACWAPPSPGWEIRLWRRGLPPYKSAVGRGREPQPARSLPWAGNP